MKEQRAVNDGLFYHNVDGEPQVFRVSWDDRYRLEQLSEYPGTFQLPRQSELVASDELPNVSIVGVENSGGGSGFIRWLLADRPDSLDWQLVTFEDAAQRLQQESPALAALLDRSLDLPGGANAAESARIAELAGMVEDEQWRSSGNRLLVLTSTVRELTTDDLYSNILSRGHLYRLARFTVDDLVAWCEALHEKQSIGGTTQKEIRELAETAKGWIGGQPLLSHLFFRMVDDRFPSLNRWRVDLPEVVEQAGRYILNHRPHIVHRWTDPLQEMIKEMPVRRRLEAYVAGSTKKNDPAASDWIDVQLFLAGWIDRNINDEWAITSRCHKSWAADVLRGI